jgi:hypothetical protein
MLDGSAFRLLDFRHAVADVPEVLNLGEVLGKGGVFDQLGFKSFAQNASP